MALFGGFTVDHADFQSLTIDCADILQYDQAVKFAYACACQTPGWKGEEPG